MLGDTWDRRTKNLKQAAQIVGGEKVLAKAMRINRATLNKLTNYPDKKTDLRKLILAEKCSGVRLENLDFDDEVTDYLRVRNHQLILRSVPKQDILIKGTISLLHCQPNHHIVIDTDMVLISGLMNFNQSIDDKVKVIVLDLKALLSDPKLKASLIPPFFVHSEYFAIGLRLEQLLGGNRQGQRSDLKVNNKAKNNSQPLPTWGEVKGRKDIEVAKLLGYSTNTYYRGKQVYRYGISELIDAMNDKSLRIGAAAKIAKFPKKEQIEYLKSKEKWI